MDASRSAMHPALQQQIASLEAIAARVTDCRRRLPQSSDGVWRGAAQSAYAAALAGLSDELGGAARQLAAALTRAKLISATESRA